MKPERMGHGSSRVRGAFSLRPDFVSKSGFMPSEPGLTGRTLSHYRIGASIGAGDMYAGVP
jgi:hypothetical protein